MNTKGTLIELENERWGDPTVPALVERGVMVCELCCAPDPLVLKNGGRICRECRSILTKEFGREI